MAPSRYLLTPPKWTEKLSPASKTAPLTWVSSASKPATKIPWPSKPETQDSAMTATTSFTSMPAKWPKPPYTWAAKTQKSPSKTIKYSTTKSKTKIRPHWPLSTRYLQVRCLLKSIAVRSRSICRTWLRDGASSSKRIRKNTNNYTTSPKMNPHTIPSTSRSPPQNCQLTTPSKWSLMLMPAIICTNLTLENILT